MSAEDYATQHKFVWFLGVVEDIQDPEQMGRVRVRCFGYHTKDKNLIKTEDLPWATVMNGVTSASMTGVGNSSTGLLPGSWVVGFFRDGTSAQDPLVMGSVASKSTKKDQNEKIGFSDPDNVYPLEALLNEPDIPRESRSSLDASDQPYYKSSFSYLEKDRLKVSYNGVSTANDGPEWDFPSCADVIKPEYPKNHVHAFVDNSNIIEYDSTKDNHRYSHVGPNKTFTEIDRTGNVSQIITGANYKVIAQGDNVFIKGGCNLTIEDGCRTMIKGNWEIFVDGNKNEVVTGNVTETFKGNQTTKVSENIDIDAKRIDLN
jgi:hypothetical protein